MTPEAVITESPPGSAAHLQQQPVDPLSAEAVQAAEDAWGALIVVAGDKGGVGKSTLAYELAAALGAVLVDLDWTGGSVTRSWGLQYDKVRVERTAIALYFNPGRDLKPYRGPSKPDLIPGRPEIEDYERNENAAKAIAAELRRLSERKVIVVDTHPGLNPLTRAAVQASDLCVVPVPLTKTKELNSLEEMLRGGLAQNPVLLVPSMVPTRISKADFARFQKLLAPFEDLPISPPISYRRLWEKRLVPAAVSLQPNPGKEIREARHEIDLVAAAVRDRLMAAAA